MKKISLLYTLIMLVPVLTAQYGKVFDNLSVESEILGMERKYAVYLPPDYETSERSYPVLYLLHGGGDDQTGWVQFGEVLRIADEAIANGTATAMIIVMPIFYGLIGFIFGALGAWLYNLMAKWIGGVKLEFE